MTVDEIVDDVTHNPEHWPQRAVFQASLAPGLALELIVTAYRE